MSGIGLLKSMMENRKMNGLNNAVANMGIQGPLAKSSAPGTRAYKMKIIEEELKHPEIKKHFEAIVSKCEADDCSTDEE